MSNLHLIAVSGSSIELGPIPFNLYARDNQGRMVLFCKTGFPITERHRGILISRRGIFYVSNEELDAFHDYNLERLEKVIANDHIELGEKVEIVHGVGKRIVTKLLQDPRSGRAISHSGKFINTVIDMIFNFPDITDKLLSFGATDTYSLSHSLNVCTFSLLIGKKLLSDNRQELWLLGMSGLLHDLGMIRIPMVILNKAGELTNEEMAVIRQHPIYTVDYLTEHHLPDSVTESCRSHHERKDGSGYPDGRSGAKIHPFARIVSVADVYDALTTDRPYRKKMSLLEALSEMARQNHLYDSDALRTLMSIVLQNEDLYHGFIRRYNL
jgi:HD-GYP domain-containing protein (c-di-GMP phosphodiesterase class II)